MRATLTELSLRAAKPPERGTTTIWDGSLKHFGVRISQGGATSFVILIGSGRRQVIGRYPAISLAQARGKAKQLLAERTLGRHQPSAVSWQTATQEFNAACAAKNRARTSSEYERTLQRYFSFGTTRLSEISRTDISRKLDRLQDTPSQQSHARVIAKIFFNWALKRGYVDANPVAGTTGHKSTTRARVLSDAELKCLWEACEQRSPLAPWKSSEHGEEAKDPAGESPEGRALPAHFAAIVKLLI